MTLFRPLSAVLVLSAALLGSSCNNSTNSTPDAGTTGPIVLPLHMAHADIKDTAMPPNVIGTVDFAEHPTDSVAIDIRIVNATPGKHGMHIHAEGVCDPTTNFMSAGGHYNPGQSNHGAPSDEMHHAGDFGNIDIMLVGANGQGRLQLFSKTISLDPDSPNTVIGKAIIFHASEDDLRTQPTGNSGGRVGCGVIK